MSSKEVRVSITGKVVEVEKSFKYTSISNKIIQPEMPQAKSSEQVESIEAMEGNDGSPLGALQRLVASNGSGNNSASIVKGIIDEGVKECDYWLNRTLQATDNYQGQRTIAIAKSLGSWTQSTGMKIINGFATGGPVGGIIATAMAVVDTGLSIYKNYNEEQFKIDVQNTELDMIRVRSGYSLTSGSIGGDK